MSQAEKAFEIGYQKPDRPISSRELQSTRDNIRKYMFVGNVKAYHKPCNHWYYVKSNGKKQKDIEESGNPGNCSVCWRLKTTSKHLKNKARSVAEDYMNTWHDLPEDKIDHFCVELERVFYEWLYENRA